MSTNKKEAYLFLKKMYENDLELIKTNNFNNDVLVPQAEALKIALSLFNADKWRKTDKYMPEARDMNTRGEVIVTNDDMTEAYTVVADQLLNEEGSPVFPLWKPFPKPPIIKNKPKPVSE